MPQILKSFGKRSYKLRAKIRPRSEQSHVPCEVMRNETVRKQKPVHGVEDGAAILRKGGMRNYERVREWREGKRREDKGRERKRTKGNKGKGREGKGREGKEREGRGREGRGREGKGGEGKGREDEMGLEKNRRHFSH